HARCALAGLGKLRPKVIEAALADKNPGVRRHAIRLVEPLLGDNPRLGPGVLKQLADTDAQVRLQAAYTLGEWRSPDAAVGLADLLASAGTDPFLVAAVFSSLREENLPGVLARLLDGHKDTLPPPQTLGRLFGMAGAFKQPKA